jgi:hypothetical protein
MESSPLLAAALGGLLCLTVSACSSEPDEPTGVVTSSTVDPNMTLEQFTDDCDARRGKVELHSHCGGVNSCKGFSYDEDTDVLTEHTCKGANTCAGYSCVIG